MPASHLALRRLRLIWSLIAAGLFLFVFLPAALADGPGYKTFGYNYVRPVELGNEVFIPYIAKNHGGWTSTLVIANTESISTDLAIDIFEASGLFIRGIELALPAHGSYILDLANDNELADGRYQAHIGSTSTRIAAEVHTESAYMAMSYADIGATGTDLIIPIVEKKADDWNTTFYVHNTADFSGRLTITYYADDDPNPVLTITDVSIARSESLEFQTLAESGLPDNFVGYARVTSTGVTPRVIGGMVVRKNYMQESAMAYPALDTSVLGEYLASYVPLAAKQADFWGSSILRIHVADSSFQQTTVECRFYDNVSSGLRGTLSFDASPGITYRQSLDDVSFLEPGYRGSIVVSSDYPIWTSVAQEKEEGDYFGYQTSAEADAALYVPYVSKAQFPNDWSTTIDVQNVSSSVANVRVTFYSMTGTAYSVLYTIPSFWNHAFTLSSLDILPDGFEGQAVITGYGDSLLTAVVVANKQHLVGNHARVIKDGLPRQNAVVIYGGQIQGITDAEGLLPLGDLTIGRPIAVIDPVKEKTTKRVGHDGWAYRIHTTNVTVNNDGSTTPDFRVAAPGRQVLTTSLENTLVLFNLLVSVEWDADEAYVQQISRAAQYASEYLYDLSDGQMAFGQVAIYDNGDHWADADIQISTKNIVRPHAYIGGITSGDTSHIIRVGRGWDGNSGDQGAWDQKEGYRTLAHEFGHYALYLWDEYFAYISDEHGNLVNEVPTYCTGPENRNPATEATNASVMDYQYTASELSAQGVPGLWSHLCEETAQWQMNGESPWETVVRIYADTESPPRWRFTSPIDRGSVMAGPNGLPSELLPIPEITIHNSGPSEPPRLLTVYDPEGKPFWGAIVALYKQDGRVIGQGFTDGNGRLNIYGAEVGDTLRAASFDAGLAGRVTVGPEMSLGLTMEPVLDVTAQMAGGIPHMRVVAEPSQDPAQVDLFVFLHDFGSGADPSLIVTEPGSEAGYAPSLSYSPGTDIYEGEISFSATELGTGRIRSIGAVGDSLVRLQSTYRLHRVLNSQSHEVYSDDGNLSLYLEPGVLPGEEAYLVVMPTGAVPGPLPEGLALVGDPYDVTASGALVELEKPGILKLRYDGVLVTSSSAPEGLAIYRWDPNSQTWQGIGGSVDEAQKALMAPVQTLGTYALLAPLGDWNVPPSSPIFLPVIFKNAH